MSRCVLTEGCIVNPVNASDAVKLPEDGSPRKNTDVGDSISL